jgi:hypothetical protein
VPPHKISLSSRINLDLGVAGDDGVELIQAFGKAFGVDVSTFPYMKHFGSEGINPFALFGMLFRFVTGRRVINLDPLTVRDLLMLAKSAPEAGSDGAVPA